MFHKSRCCRCCESGIDSRQGRARHIRKQTTFFARINTHMANIGCVNFSHVVLQYQQQTTNKHRNTHTTLTNMTSVSSPNLIFNFCSTDENRAGRTGNATNTILLGILSMHNGYYGRHFWYGYNSYAVRTFTHDARFMLRTWNVRVFDVCGIASGELNFVARYLSCT